MRPRLKFGSILGLVALGALSSACVSSGPELEPQVPVRNSTRLTAPVVQFGELLRAYPMRRPYRFDAPVILGLVPILNYSGEDGLPPDLSTVLTTIVSQVGEPIWPKPSHSFREIEVGAIAGIRRMGPEADLTIRGSVTEGEKRRTTEFSVDMDILFEDSAEDGRPGRDSVDTGGSYGRGNEVWTLALDLHLVEESGLVVQAVSHRVDVVRRGRTASYGVFFRGSGLGFRSRKLIAQSRSHALRLAAQQSVVVLLGRHFRIPYWRVFSDGVPDLELIDTYRRALKSGESPEDFRLLLFAHGLDIALDSYTFSESEERAVADLKRRLGLPANTSDLDLAMHLWQTVPFGSSGSRIAALRTLLSAEDSQQPLAQRSALSADSLVNMISGLSEGQELYVPVFFEYGHSILSEPAKLRIDLLMEALKASGRLEDDWWFDLRGHSDARGERAKLRELSEKRTARVRAHLEQKHAVPSERIVSAGFGATEPIKANAQSEQEHGENRRVEILLVAGERPAATPASGAVPEAREAARAAALFPPGKWPLPVGIELPGDLSASTLSVVRGAYPAGRLSAAFGYYSVRLEAAASDLFSEMIFVFTERAHDPRVAWVGFSCRDGVQEHLAPAVSRRYPQARGSGYLESATRWVDLDGYHLTVALEPYCLKIEPAA